MLARVDLTGLLQVWSRGDEEALVRHANNPKVSRHMRDRFTSPYTLDDAEWWIGHASAQSPPTNFALVVDGEAAGGIGFMLVYLAKERRVSIVDFGPISPGGLDPAAYPLTGSGATSRDLFNWPAVKDDRNVHGPLSFAVPGHVDGLGIALERFGTMKFADVIKPAIELAERGIAVDWFLTLKVATMARELARYPTTRDVWLPHGFPPVTAPGASLEWLKLKGLAGTLRQLADAGQRDFYEGGIAAAIAKDVKAMGGTLGLEDLRSYRARVVAPLTADYRGVQFSLAPALTAGPSMARALNGLRSLRFHRGGPHADAFIAYAQSLREAYAERLATMGETADALDPRLQKASLKNK